MQGQFIQYIFIILIIIALVMLANRLKIAYPIILVLGGLVISFTDSFSHINIKPEWVFFIFLPPLLYEAAWQTSWKQFWKWRRVIMSFAFPIVIITACVIAFVSSTVIPGFTLALGFLLGGIISPPDAISATTIMRQVKVPKSLVSIIEGESLMNDASSLIIVRFASIAVLTGQFNLQEATVDFFLVVIMGTVIGITVGLIFYAIHRLLPASSNIEVILTLVTPYCMYYAAEHFEFSGVLAVVSGGLVLSSKRQHMLNYRTRIESVNVWTNFVFLLNGLIFLLIGLQLPLIIAELGNTSLSSAIWYGLIISLLLIVTRLACTFGASVFTRFMSRFITVADANPGWKGPLVLGWAGMRGVVSLAAALSIPFVNANGQAFPYRNLILFITFIVILMTLVFQGLTLPWLIDKLNLEDKYALIPEDQQQLIIQKRVADDSIDFLKEQYGNNFPDNERLHNLLEKLEIDTRIANPEERIGIGSDNNTDIDFSGLYLQLLDRQRMQLQSLMKDPQFDEELIKTHLAIIDLEEFKTREIADLESKVE